MRPPTLKTSVVSSKGVLLLHERQRKAVIAVFENIHDRKFLRRSEDNSFWHNCCDFTRRNVKNSIVMKKILLYLPVMLILAAGFGCSEQRKWNREQRKEMREMLRDYRQMAYLNDLTDAEFILFSDDVATALEGDYPVYATFVTMPGVEDTVQLVIVETVVEELQADARNMRHIFPYEQLVAREDASGRIGSRPAARLLQLPGRQGEQHLRHAGPVRQRRVADTVNTSTMQRLEGQCANDLF